MTDVGTAPRRARKGWVAALLAVFHASVAMLYVGRPRRAGVYLLVTVLLPVAAVALARFGLWPAGVPVWSLLVMLVLIGIADAYRIARRSARSFGGPWFTTWRGVAAVMLAVLGLTTGVRTFALEPAWTPSPAMLPTVHRNDQFVVSKLAFRIGQPQRGDVIVIRAPNADVNYLKRLIGLPGDIVVYDGVSKRLTVNGVSAELVTVGDYDSDPTAEIVRETLGNRSHLALLRRDSLGIGGTYSVPDGH